MGFYSDFIDSLLGDNVASLIGELEQHIRDIHHSETQSQIHKRDWKYRQAYCKRAQQIQQRHIMRSFHNMRSRVKS